MPTSNKGKPLSIESMYQDCKHLVRAQSSVQEWMKNPPEDKLEYIEATITALVHAMQTAQIKAIDLQDEQTKLCKNCDQILNLLLVARSK